MVALSLPELHASAMPNTVSSMVPHSTCGVSVLLTPIWSSGLMQWGCIPTEYHAHELSGAWCLCALVCALLLQCSPDTHHAVQQACRLFLGFGAVLQPIGSVTRVQPLPTSAFSQFDVHLRRRHFLAPFRS